MPSHWHASDVNGVRCRHRHRTRGEAGECLRRRLAAYAAGAAAVFSEKISFGHGGGKKNKGVGNER